MRLNASVVPMSGLRRARAHRQPIAAAAERNLRAGGDLALLHQAVEVADQDRGVERAPPSISLRRNDATPSRMVTLWPLARSNDGMSSSRTALMALEAVSEMSAATAGEATPGLRAQPPIQGRLKFS